MQNDPSQLAVLFFLPPSFLAHFLVRVPDIKSTSVLIWLIFPPPLVNQKILVEKREKRHGGVHL